MRTNGWSIKVYGNERPSPVLVEAAKDLARLRLPNPAATDERYGLGILTVHEGRDANWVLIDWWAHEDALQHHVYSSPLGHPERFDYASP